MRIKTKSFTRQTGIPAQSRAAIRAELQRRIRGLERDTGALARTAVPSGSPALDAILPWQGLPRSGLHVVQGSAGEAAVYGFAAVLAGCLRGGDGGMAWIQHGANRQETGVPYGPGLAHLKISARRLLLVKARRAVDVLWGMEEALRCPALAVVIGEGVAPDLTAARRLQLAAERGGTAALLIPPPGAAPASTALTWWRVRPAPAARDLLSPLHPAWDVELVRCRGGTPGHWRMEWRHETLHFDLATPLAHRPAAAAG